MNIITKFPKGIEHVEIAAGGGQKGEFWPNERAVIPQQHGIDTAVLETLGGRIPKAIQPLTAIQLLSAGRDILEERAREYERPEGERSTQAIVTAFNAITGRDLKESEGWLFLQLLKNVRLFSVKGYHADSGIDGINYAALMAEAKAREAS